MLHYRITVIGKVQGVWYRKSTLNKAKELGLKGFVQNKVDKSVYIEAEGSEEQLKSLVSWCYEGSTFSDVKEVNYEIGELKNFEIFEIVR